MKKIPLLLLAPLLFYIVFGAVMPRAHALECPAGEIPCPVNGGPDEMCYEGTECPSDFVSGQGVRDSENKGLVNPLEVDSLRELGLVLFDVAKTLLEIVLVAALVWCGWLFIEAQGNQDKLTKARKALMFTVIGGIMVLGVNVVYEIIVATIEQI